MVVRLMAMEPLGGRKATELLTPRDDQFFAWAFLQRLLREARFLLAHDDHSDMRKLAEKADGLLALHQPQGHYLQAVAIAACSAGSSAPPPAPEDDLTVAAAASRVGHAGKKKKKQSGKPRRRSRSPADFQSPLCHYHVRYGDKAYKCEEPCAWPGN
jgi:hypothetical protein